MKHYKKFTYLFVNFEFVQWSLCAIKNSCNLKYRA